MSTPDFSGRKDNPVVVIGSLNMDLVMRTPRVPVGGETLHGHEFSTLPGGKGANQAVACARLGAKVAMIGQVGNDGFGTTLRDGLAADGIDTSGVLQTSAVGTGVAMILVEDIGQNRIVLAAGANGALTPADIDAHAARIGGAAMLVLQLEVPMPVVQRAIGIAHAAGVPVLLNPGPASPLPEAVWSQIDILVPNESEATLLSGVEVSDATSAYAAAKVFRQRGVKCVLITLGANGVAVIDDAGERHLPAHVVKAVDTTAAGDTFIGGLSAGLVEGLAMDDAVALGQRASALCVTRHGAQPSIPYRREIA
ncbi:MAG: ribokinase [Propionivibrio sp.]|jgi:ribokinase|uniref:ribokinase n=1 Tax=Propionivibrio sp. TaxID=2212460 RepID=UPI001B7189CA|nr:ribokinase [Propionivibrio sp.]MBP7204140.1 ribokinase [Propionivibrio sp.]